MGARSWLSRRAASFSPSTIQQLSYLAQRCNAINLAEGFPDFPAPFEIKEAAVAAIRADLNQYRHVQGVCDKVAQMFERTQGIQMDPMSEITICCGQTEAMAAAIFAGQGHFWTSIGPRDLDYLLSQQMPSRILVVEMSHAALFLFISSILGFLLGPNREGTP